jgi:hypothetical protein
LVELVVTTRFSADCVLWLKATFQAAALEWLDTRTFRARTPGPTCVMADVRTPRRLTSNPMTGSVPSPTVSSVAPRNVRLTGLNAIDSELKPMPAVLL